MEIELNEIYAGLARAPNSNFNSSTKQSDFDFEKVTYKKRTKQLARGCIYLCPQPQSKSI